MALRVLTFNVWDLPWPVSRHRQRRMRVIARRLPELGCDIAAFQEVWSEDARSVLIEAGRDDGLEHVWHRPNALGGSGLLVLSRLPIRSQSFTRYVLCGLPQRLLHMDYYSGKGLALLSLTTDEGSLTFVNTHLHARYGRYARTEDEYLGHRASEIVQLATALASHDEPAVVVGDFNVTEGSPEYAILLGLTGLEDSAAQLDARQTTAVPDNPYRVRGRPGTRIDYVFTRAGVGRSAAARAVERVLDEPLEIDGEEASYSDHAGVIAEIELARGPSSLPRPTPEALEQAHVLLDQGREIARRRRSRTRAWGGAVSGIAMLGSAAAWRGPLPRRGFLRVAAIGLPALALTGGTAAMALEEGFVRNELRAYDDVQALLLELQRT